mgnify:CR=1 FL=1
MLEAGGALFILIIGTVAIISVLPIGASTGEKVLWILLIIFLPIIGAIAWLLVGPRGRAV